jgi:serine/threonine protein kinase/AmiR/NasT family two-component response regulator
MSAGDVFIVDDNPNNLNLLTRILRDAGYQVRMANSGKRALSAVQQNPPHLILLDINMPEMDGYAVCRALKQDPRTESIPVIFLSALDDVDEKLNGFRAGGVDYVTKPFHAEEVLARVESQVQLFRLRSLLEERNRELSRRNAELEASNHAAQRIFGTVSELLPGRELDRGYRIGPKIGSGGFAIVYRGEAADGRAVAIKVLRPQPGEERPNQNRMRVEALSSIRIRHPSAVTVIDGGVTPSGIAYLVMELLQGRTLAEELANGPLSVERAAQLFLPVCEALAEAHAAGVIHRDVKPANIFLHRSNEIERVKIVDFGIAKLDDEAGVEHATTLGRLIGTPVYMSPERLLGQPYDGGADVYALAVTLYQSLTGRLPFVLADDAALGALIMTCLSERPSPIDELLPALPATLCDLVMRALDRSAARRPSMAELAAALGAIVGAPVALPDAEPLYADERTTLDSPLLRR